MRTGVLNSRIPKINERTSIMISLVFLIREYLVLYFSVTFDPDSLPFQDDNAFYRIATKKFFHLIINKYKIMPPKSQQQPSIPKTEPVNAKKRKIQAISNSIPQVTDTKPDGKRRKLTIAPDQN